VFEEVYAGNMSFTSSQREPMLKLLLKNNLSAKIKLELRPASDNKFKIEPCNICLSAFESI